MIVKRVISSLFIRIFSAASSFFVAVLIARVLGERDAGFYFFAIAILNFLAVTVRIGMDKLILRQVSIHNTTIDIAKINNILGLSFSVIFCLSAIIGTLLWIFSELIALSILKMPDMHSALCVVSLSIFFLAVTTVMAEALQGLSRFVESVFVINILPNIVVFLFFLPGFLDWISVSLEYSLLVIFFSYVISFLAGLFFLRDVFCRRFPEIRKAYDSGFLNGFGSMYAVDLMAVNILWASQILAGFWLRADELAHLASAQRTAAIAGLLLIAINTVTAPRYAAMYHEGRHADLKHLAQSSTMAVLFIALPLVGLMCTFPSPIMSLFGDDFRDASVLLVVLAIGQLANAATGSVGYLLIMSGHQRDLRNVAFVSGMSAIIFPLILLPVMGVIGAAVSSSLAVATQNLLAMYMVRRRLGFWTFSFAAATLLFSKTVKLAPKLTRE